MGICASSQYSRKEGRFLMTNNGSSPSTSKVINSVDGGLYEFRQPIRAATLLSDHPDTFLCNSETMFVDSHVPHVPADEDLQLGQIYFLMPLSISNKPLSLQQLCSLAIKASSALDTSFETGRKPNSVSFRGKSNVNQFQLALKRLDQ